MGEPNVSMVQAIAEAIWEKKGFEVSAYAVGDVLDYTDCMVIASAGSDRQTLAIADSVEQVMRDQYGEKPMGREGRSNARWVLLDYSDVVVHVFHRPVRDYYELDRLYGDVPRVPLEEPAWVAEFADPAADWAAASDYDLPDWDGSDDEASDDEASDDEASDDSETAPGDDGLPLPTAETGQGGAHDAPLQLSPGQEAALAPRAAGAADEPSDLEP